MRNPLLPLVRDEWRSRFGCPPPPTPVLMAEPWIDPYLRLMFPPVPALAREDATVDELLAEEA
jgi:hypothetical protein